jgi:trehalose 2-sulfotransferase
MRPHTCYLVCATPRSGSTFLCSVLANTRIAGRPEEYFQIPIVLPQDYFETKGSTGVAELLSGSWPDSESVEPAVWDSANYADYLAQVMEEGTTPNGVFGAKLMWGHLDYFIDNLRGIAQYRELAVSDLLSAVFPNLHYISVRRQDKLRQAVSLWKAIQTWTWKAGEPPEGKFSYLQREPRFHYDAIDFLLQQLAVHEASWQQYFAANGIEPFTIDYEEWVPTYEATARSILQYCHIHIPENLVISESDMQRQADALSEEWVRQYDLQKHNREEQTLAE